MLTESGFFKEDAPRSLRSSVPPDLAQGRRIAEKYELLRKVGVGAMGEVWAAKHLSLDEEVAIKLVIRDVEHEDGSTADGRFLVEARVARMLSRKTRHVVSVTDHGDDGPMAYLVMELLNGEPLDTRLARSGPLPLEKVVPLIQQVARALAFAHADGIVHRDLKPGNVFLTLDEEGKPLIKILDFGIAKLHVDDGRRDSVASKDGREARGHGLSAQDARQATLRGFLLGTPAYMSPEQARGKAIDHRADVWALGVITYHLLTTQFPFDGANAEELFKRLVRVQAYPITDHRPDLPPAISELFERAFAKKIDDRFPSAEAFATALDRAAGKREDIMFSLPPPAPSAARKGESSSMAAGVPRKGNHGLAIGAVVVLALLGIIATGYRHFAPAGTPATGLAAGSVTTEASSTTTLSRSDDVIPPPEPAPPRPVATVAPVPPLVPAPPPAEPIAIPVPVAPPPPRPAKPVDRSEVF